MDDCAQPFKIVIVTGGGGGMGQAAAKRFAGAGAKTFVFGRTLETLQESAALSTKIAPIVCDVADSASIISGMAEVLKHGTPQALVHTSCINIADRFMAQADSVRIASTETWQKVMDINSQLINPSAACPHKSAHPGWIGD